MVLGHPGHQPEAVVRVRLAVAATHGIVVHWAGVRLGHTHTGHVGATTHDVADLSLVALLTGRRAALKLRPGAWAVVVFGHPGHDPFAVVPVGLAVTATHRLVHLQTGLRLGNAHARGILGAALQVAHGPLQAVQTSRTTALLAHRLAGPVVVLGHPGHQPFAVVRVGLVVAPAHRLVDLGARVRLGNTLTHGVVRTALQVAHLPIATQRSRRATLPFHDAVGVWLGTEVVAYPVLVPALALTPVLGPLGLRRGPCLPLRDRPTGIVAARDEHACGEKTHYFQRQMLPHHRRTSCSMSPSQRRAANPPCNVRTNRQEPANPVPTRFSKRARPRNLETFFTAPKAS